MASVQATRAKLRRITLPALVCAAACGQGQPTSRRAQAPVAAQRADDEAPVGLSLFFREGAIAPITLVGNPPRYLQEIDIVSSAMTPTDQGVEPLIASGALGNLDWT